MLPIFRSFYSSVLECNLVCYFSCIYAKLKDRSAQQLRVISILLYLQTKHHVHVARRIFSSTYLKQNTLVAHNNPLNEVRSKIL